MKLQNNLFEGRKYDFIFTWAPMEVNPVDCLECSVLVNFVFYHLRHRNLIELSRIITGAYVGTIRHDQPLLLL